MVAPTEYCFDSVGEGFPLPLVRIFIPSTGGALARLLARRRRARGGFLKKAPS